jgi:L-ribulose-5-phosphate 3-epimerase
MNIRMFSFFIPADHAPGEYRDEVLLRWSKFIDAAKDTGLMLLHENERIIYGDSAERCLDLLDTLNCPFVKAVFDPANFVQFGSAAYPGSYNLLKKHIAYVHIKDAFFRDKSVVPAGEGDARVEDILRELKKDGYEGYLSIEPHLNNNEPGGGPGMFAMATGALKKILKRL